MVHARTYTLTAAMGLAGLVVAPLLPQAALAAPSGPTVHVVEPGETLGDIASRQGVDADTLIRLNNLDNPDLLSVGQSLSVPGAPAAPSAPSAPSGDSTYTVVDGDTLWGIALHFNTTADALLSANSLDNPDSLSIGTQLSLPAGAAPTTTKKPVAAPSAAYTVQSGDTLYALARKFDLSLSALAAANHLDDPNRLSTGAVLSIPGKSASAGAPPASTPAPAPPPRAGAPRQHVVRVGETLRDIAAQEKVDLGALIDVNHLDDPELIRVGQVVVVPPTPAQINASAAADGRPAALSMASAAASSASPPRSVPSPAAASQPSSAAPAAPAPSPTPARPAAPAPSSAATSPTSTRAAAAPASAALAPVGPPNASLASAALKFQGARYVFGGSSPAGFDCSGFVWYVARQQGKPIPRGMLGEYNSGPHPGRNDLKPGDLVFFQNTYMPGLSHNGIYIGNNKFVNAADEKSGVTISDMTSAFWSSRWFGATRLSS